MEVKAYIKNVRSSPRKLRILLEEIKQKNPQEALFYLLYTPKKAARILHKALKSAISNATSSLKVSDERLKFKMLVVEEGQKLKRFQPGGRGTVSPYSKRFSHIKIILEESKEPNLKKEIKSEDKKQVKEETIKQDKKLQVSPKNRSSAGRNKK